MRIRKYGINDSPECVYAKKKSARWLFNLLESGLIPDDDFFAFFEWVTGCLKKILSQVKDELAKKPDCPEYAKACDDLQSIIKHFIRYRSIDCNLPGLIEDYYPFAGKMIIDLVKLELSARRKISLEESAMYKQARKRLERTFGLNREQIDLCEFVFIVRSFEPVERYFSSSSSIEIFELRNRGMLSNVLETGLPSLRKCLSELISCGILANGRSSYICIPDELLPLWDASGEKSAEALFCRPIGKKSLPLGDFNIPPEELKHVKSLLAAEDSAPLHILLYGPPGTGKTTFAASLANDLKLRAWSVPFNKDDLKSGRRAALKACINMASKHKGAFVLLDEADRFLDTGDRFSGTTIDKAWINGFLEEPERRVVWIVNDIDQIDASVRRRFTFAIRFGELNGMERKKVWAGVLADHRVKKSIPEPEIERLAREYKVPTAVVESAVRQVKTLSRAGREFTETAELVLRSYLTLSRGGVKPRALDRMDEEYTTAGVSLGGSVDELLDRCRRIDARCRDDMPPGGGTMLFYGPPGTGKTALARHIARELDRECAVRRASDLLSCYVGVSEQNVAAAFRRAEAEGSVLVIDEVDSLLYSREIAVRSWESTLVNEFLTSLEEYRGFCICTTNRLQSIDAAALRRFSVKIPFGYAGPEQVETLYRSLLAPLASGKLKEDEKKCLLELSSLTPGDFRTVRSQFRLMDREEISHRRLIDGLAAEQSAKQNHAGRRVGF